MKLKRNGISNMISPFSKDIHNRATSQQGYILKNIARTQHLTSLRYFDAGRSHSARSIILSNHHMDIQDYAMEAHMPISRMSYYDSSDDYYQAETLSTNNKNNNKNSKENKNIMMINSIVNEYKNKMIKSTVQMVGDKIKNKFGIEYIADCASFDMVNEFLKKYDRNYKNHLQNPMFENTAVSRFPEIIEKPFIVKLRNDTFLYCNRFNRQDDENYVYNKMRLFFFGKKSYKYFKILIKYLSKDDKVPFRTYHISSSTNGEFGVIVTCETPRNIDTLYFDNNTKEKIITHLNNWRKNESIYKSRGIIYKTGILLYGTAGTGKSTLAMAIADYLNCPILSIDCTEFHNIDIGQLTASINADNCQYVVLLDEIDSIFVDRDDIKMSMKERTSKLLTFLDSPNSPTDVIFVATTNYIDRLDKAALRKGRFDLMVELNDIHKEAALCMCKGFELTDSQILEVMNKVTTFPINPSTLQSIILEVKAGRDIEEV